MFMSIALSRVVPALFPDATGEDNLNGLESVVAKVKKLVGSLEDDGKHISYHSRGTSSLCLPVNSMLTAEFTSLRAAPNSLSSSALYKTPRRQTPPAVPPPFTGLPRLTNATMPGEEIMGLLEREMEEMVIEGTVLNEVSGGGESVKGRAMGGAVRGVLERLAREGAGEPSGSVVRRGLPSPRPSPSPPPPPGAFPTRRPGYIRARSISY